eukprot:scaffold20324_cov86-Cylindrotheca_fusiformis.AAC.4
MACCCILRSKKRSSDVWVITVQSLTLPVTLALSNILNHGVVTSGTSRFQWCIMMSPFNSHHQLHQGLII